jgi:hypothetical protein
MPMGSNKVAAATLLTNVFLDILILLGYIGTSGVEILS